MTTQKLYVTQRREVDLEGFDYELSQKGIQLNTNAEVLQYLTKRKNRNGKSKDIYILLQNLSGGRTFNHNQVKTIKEYNGKFDQAIDSWYITVSEGEI